MKKILRPIALSLCLCLAVPVSGMAWATKNEDVIGGSGQSGAQSGSDLFYDDFSADKEGGVPQGYQLSLNDCQITVEETDVGNGQKKNCMLLYDTRNEGSTDFAGPKAVRYFEKQSSAFAVEFRFKTVKTKTDIAPINIEIKMDNDTAYSITTPSDTGILSFNNGSPKPIAGNQKLPFDTWFTVRTVFDMEAQKVDLLIQSDYLKNYEGTLPSNIDFDKKLGRIILTNQTPRETFSGTAVNNIAVSMSRWEGKNYFDYIKVEKDAPRLKSNASGPAMKPPVVENPAAIPSGRYRNLYYDGQYYFWNDRLLSMESRTLISLAPFAELLNFDYTLEDGSIRIAKGEKMLVMTVGKTEVSVNGSPAAMDAAAFQKSGVLYVPLRFVAENLGYAVGWREETQTITIEEVQQP